MTRSVYIVGGAGSGKSTFTQALLDGLPPLGPLQDLHSKPNSRGTVITLRGHRVGDDGMYLGCMRESFPGTDGLDRISYIPGEEWLQTARLPEWILGEGTVLTVERFLAVLHETTDLLLVHLYAEDWVKDLRFRQRGSDQADSFVTASATRSLNLVAKMLKRDCSVLEVDTAEPDQWRRAVERCRLHLLGMQVVI